MGTAGHIDHGKTSLVRALTGIDTDRLAEEKKRGISIDLGFAHLTLPGGERIGFIDVPGHERFIKNMLAGVAGMDAVLLIVAADESVKPQTREHFDICRLLQIRDGLIVLTKIDLANPDQIAACRADVLQLVKGSFLENAPVLQVSAKTGQGLDTLKDHLASLRSRANGRATDGFALLPIDRSFALKGFGTVVTGTLSRGRFRSGDSVIVHPVGRQARIRGLQVHGRAVEEAIAGQRTAVNLTGIEHSEIRRGFTLMPNEELETTTVFDAEMEWLDADTVPISRQQFFVHIGTAEMLADVKPLPGKRFARIALSEPVLAFPGHRFILRRPSPAATIGGGVVVDSFPHKRMNRTKILARLEALSRVTLSDYLGALVDASPRGEQLRDLVRKTGEPPENVKAAVTRNPDLVFLEPSQRVVGKRVIEQKRRDLIRWLANFHAANPTAPGAPIAQARRHVDAAVADIILDRDPAIAVRGDLIALAAHKVRVSSGELDALIRLEQIYRDAGFHPPLVNDALKDIEPDPKKARGLLERLIKSQRLIRLSPDLVYHSDVISHVRNSLAAHKGRKFSVPEFKDWTRISRKYAIPLLEYLDRVHVTKREGDSRVVL